MNSSYQVEPSHGESILFPTRGSVNLQNLGLPANNMSPNLVDGRNCSNTEMARESGALSHMESKEKERSRSPPRCPHGCGKQYNKGSQFERESTPHGVPSEQVRAKTGFDIHHQEWKVPFVGQDPVTGKVYFIDTTPNATNLNTTILCKRHLWYQCPFNTYHLIKTSKKFVTHIRRCIQQSPLGYNGKQSQKEVKNWLVCKFNSNHRVHKDYMITHYLQNCPEQVKSLSLSWEENKEETAT